MKLDLDWWCFGCRQPLGKGCCVECQLARGENPEDNDELAEVGTHGGDEANDWALAPGEEFNGYE